GRDPAWRPVRGRFCLRRQRRAEARRARLDAAQGADLALPDALRTTAAPRALLSLQSVVPLLSCEGRADLVSPLNLRGALPRFHQLPARPRGSGPHRPVYDGGLYPAGAAR